MKMEDYEIFCRKHLSRIQEEAIKGETSLTAQNKNISFIQFYGIPVLSPLLSLEKKKEIQQYKEKALDLETRKRESRKKTLLKRVQEIVENVQMKKGPSMTDVNTSEAESSCPDLDSKALTDFTAVSDTSSACSPEKHGSMNLEKTPELRPSDTAGQTTSNVTEVVKAPEENVSSKPSKSRFSEAVPYPKVASPDKVCNKLPSHTLQKQEGRVGSPSDEDVQDPCVMSLQNLIKKSREYIEKEQSKRTSKSNSKRSTNESHSDKENDGVKTTESVKDRAKFTGRSCTAQTLDKPSLNKSNTLLQGASTHTNNTNMSTLSSFSKVDIPMRVGTPPLVDSDSDEEKELKKNSVFERDNSIVRSLTGSYAKLPSPEPSMSPKMHRRRPRPLSMGHIIINNPVNAYELSPKGKGRAMDLIMQDIADKNNVSESVPKFMVDFTTVCPGRVPAVSRSSSGPCDGLGAGKPNRHSFGYFESRGTVSATVEGQLVMDNRGPFKIESSTSMAPPKVNEPFGSSQSAVAHKILAVNEMKPSTLPENTKCNSPVELNKSYDVENPSPLLMQSKNVRQQMDNTPNVSPANEQFPENFEKVKRRLDLDTDNCQKESSSCVLGVGMEEQEKQWLQEQKYPVGSVYITKNAVLENMAKEDILKNKMLAFEEMRKRLEEQHAQQLSILIAEQEREQEKLQKELEEQERKLKGKKVTTTEIEISKVNINSRMELEWRKKSESGLLESVQSQLETVHNTNSTSIGFAHTTPSTYSSTSETSFYLWGPSGSGVIKTSVCRPSNRIKTRWTQVFSPEIQMKFDKITAVAKGFLTRRLLQTEKLKHLKQTVKDTLEFIKTFQSEAPLKRGNVSAQDASLHERVMAQLRAALYDIHDIFFTMEASERMNILRHDREVRKEKMLRQMDKVKSPRERVPLSTATQKSLDRKKFMKASEMGIPSKKVIIKQKAPENRILQPNQGQNAPVHRLLCRQGTPKAPENGVGQNRRKASGSRVSNKSVSGAYAGRTQRKKQNVVII
ncbi:PREDICTED: centriolar coiled-coil protein of 110 kDa isoform X1 [Pseudopodoces humilis]|uniref:centriolar coiled-coil protein of 110 kDa isoform X1 n=1 Tax=Pseudopodoces humilis TaxID=181119 RepID=UPI0006B6CCAD|nr:PREDICTED: centriolar coiled-coil protein of 110 kDa isoform X1 [Pseudopodoces humilis]XP_014108261.1 PREDICTED: centriolar coiled-coil protein of 110 kDa isoform X1 [Pseudopodoces humilis]